MPSPRIERILCPTDFSTFSVTALRHALAMAWQFKARLKVVHVIPHVYLDVDSIYGSAPWLLMSEVRHNAEEAMRVFLQPAREMSVHLETEIREGDPWKEILHSAGDMSADLVVMGTHGRGGLDRLFLGSVTEKLIRRLPCPVLTACHEEGRTWAAPGLIKRILCATDFAETSTEAMKLALELARTHHAEITLLNVVENIPDIGQTAYGAIVDIESLRGELVRRSNERLQQAIEGVNARDVTIIPRSLIGCAYKEILRVAAEERADLVLIGAQGHGVLEHMLSGSNAQHVIRGATCPVLTVRPLRPDPRPRAGISAGLTPVLAPMASLSNAVQS